MSDSDAIRPAAEAPSSGPGPSASRPLWFAPASATFKMVLQDIAFGPRGIRAARVMKSAKSLRPGECNRTRPGVVFLASRLVPPVVLASLALAGVRPARAQQPVLGEAELVAARAVLLSTDSAHGRATEVDGLGAGFVRYLADDVVYFEPGADYQQGKARVQAFLAQHGAGQTLRFHPALAEVSRDGAVGYTVGWTVLTTLGGDSVRHGKYISFWRRQADGAWNVEAWNRSGAQSAAAASPDVPSSAASRFPASRPVDLREETRKLMAVDSAFAASSVARGTAEAFYRYAAPDALELGGGNNFVVGRDAIRSQQAADAAPGQTLDWKPVVGGVGPLGDLGWTVGEYRFTVPRAGAIQTFTGKYITIWTKQRDGSWRFAADGGSSSTPPAR